MDVEIISTVQHYSRKQWLKLSASSQLTMLHHANQRCIVQVIIMAVCSVLFFWFILHLGVFLCCTNFLHLWTFHFMLYLKKTLQILFHVSAELNSSCFIYDIWTWSEFDLTQLEGALCSFGLKNSCGQVCFACWDADGGSHQLLVAHLATKYIAFFEEVPSSCVCFCPRLI